MKKLIVSGLIGFLLFGSSAYSKEVVSADKKDEAQNELRSLLNKYGNFSASFVQEVKDSEEQVLHTAKGQLLFKQPGQFLWQVNEPEPETLVSNGATLWWHNPFVEQVSIFDAKDAVATTPFALLVSQDDNVWDSFDIGKVDSGYIVRSQDENSQVLALIVKFRNDVLQSIAVRSRSERISHYSLNEQSFKLPSSVSFNFDVPVGTEIDDQRSEAQQLTSDGNVQF